MKEEKQEEGNGLDVIKLLVSVGLIIYALYILSTI